MDKLPHGILGALVLAWLLSCCGNVPADYLERACRVGCHPHASEVLWVNHSAKGTQCWCLPEGAPAYKYVPEEAAK